MAHSPASQSYTCSYQVQRSLPSLFPIPFVTLLNGSAVSANFGLIPKLACQNVPYLAENGLQNVPILAQKHSSN